MPISAPVPVPECGHSRETVKRSDLAGWAQYGYRASHCTLGGLPIAFALTGLDLERHHGRTRGDVIVCVLQRVLALTAAIRHNQDTGQPIMRSLTLYGH